MISPTVLAKNKVEEAGYQFLRDGNGWALFDLDDRHEVRGTRAKSQGDSIWASVDLLEVVL